MPSGSGRTGRPSGSPPNRESILAAAREQFAKRGYDNATIRGIAAAAGVDPALVHHYFGSKDRLFAAAIELPVAPRDLVSRVLSGHPDGLAERLLRRFFEVWGSGETAAGSALTGLLRSAASQEAAARTAREFFTREILEPIAETLDAPQPRLRAGLVYSQLIGLAMARFVIPVEAIAGVEPETLVACYAPTLQRYLAGPLPGDGGATPPTSGAPPPAPR